MELGNRIKQHRTAHGWSQDDLAEKAYVSRQTISNWENNKSYPDLQSLLLLGSLFGLSLDQLVKGDIEIMQKAINQQDIHAVHRSAVWMTVFMVLAALSAVPLAEWLGWWALVPFCLLFGAALFFALRIEKIKKQYDVQTYREVAAFLEGKTLDEIQQLRESGKRPYQNIIKVLAGRCRRDSARRSGHTVLLFPSLNKNRLRESDSPAGCFCAFAFNRSLQSCGRGTGRSPESWK